MNPPNTPAPSTSRRVFLKRLALVAAAPFAAKALARQEIAPLPAPEPLPRNPAWIAHDLFEAQGLAIKVPSNRHLYWDYVSTGGARPFMVTYHGEWNGTFKEERGCTNPAYILADLMEQSGQSPDWGSIYQWGVWCDETVISHERTAPFRADDPTPILMTPRLSYNGVIQDSDHQKEVTWRLHQLWDCFRVPSDHYTKSLETNTMVEIARTAGWTDLS